MKTPNPIDVMTGRNVRDWRRNRGLSQEKLAAHLGVTFQQVQKYEKGTNRISVSKLAEIARALQVPMAVLLEPARAAVNEGDVEPARILPSMQEEQLIADFRQLLPTQQTIVRELVAVIAAGSA